MRFTSFRRGLRLVAGLMLEDETKSTGLTLEPGYIVATGTLSGVGFAMTQQQYLRGGDEIVARIGRMGELRRCVVEV